MKTGFLTKYRAILFDLNGTMIDDMDYHIRAWHQAFRDAGAEISLERTKQECYGKNEEILERIFPGHFSIEEKDKLSIEKEKKYQAEFRPRLKLIDGLAAFLEMSYKVGIKMAIGTAAIRFNIDFVLDGLNIRHYFAAIIGAEDVAVSKPDPETWLKCARILGVNERDCLVFEDAPKGVEAAQRADMDSVVITTMYRKEEFGQYKNVQGFISNFNNGWLKI